MVSQKVFADIQTFKFGLHNRHNIRRFLEFQSESCSRSMQESRGKMESLTRNIRVSPGMFEDGIPLPILEVGEENVILEALIHNVGMDSKIRFGMAAKVNIKKMVGFFLGIHPYFLCVFRALVHMVKNPGFKIVNFEQSSKIVVISRILSSEYFLPADIQGIDKSDSITFYIQE